MPQKIMQAATWIIIFSLLCCNNDNPSPIQPIEDDNTFTNPVLSSGADPWVIQDGSYYYVTHTTGNSLRLLRTTEMSDLKYAESKTVWTPPSSGMNSKSIWAPELHRINDKWYFYYAADDGINENHRMWALENSSVDPFTGNWEDKGMVSLPDNKWAIDATLFKHTETQYVLWSGWEGDTNVRQDIFIAKMESPFSATGDRVRLSKPELPWELHGGTPTINEAPQFLSHDNKVFIIYSASGCWTDQYSLGMLWADASSDLMDPSSWTKLEDPVFTMNASSQAFGPGHNSFFKSKDGNEDWIIYHANASSGDGCGGKRSARMQKFTWDNNGFPVFGEPKALGSAIPVPSGEE